MKTRNKGSSSPIPNNLLSRPHPFVNREEEIRQVINALLDGIVSVVALVGIAGIGKTTLALEIAHRLLEKGEFTGGIIWLPARNLQSSDDLAGAVGTALGVSSTEAHSRLNSQRCLLVLDGLDEPGHQHEATIGRFLEELPALSKTLVTSRKSFEISSPIVVIQVDILNEQAAIELFASWGQQKHEVSSSERQTAAEVVRAFGYHPLALTLAARLVQGDYAEARKLFKQTFDTLAELGDEQERAALLHTLASVAQAQGDYSEALRLYRQSLEIEERSSDLQGKSATLNNLAQIYFTRGDLDRALALYRESLAISERIGLANKSKRTRIALANTALELGKQHIKQDRWYDALYLFEESLVIYRQGDDLENRADAIFQIAYTHYLMGNLGKARTHYRDALRLYEHTQNQSGIAASKTGLGRLMIKMGFLDDAIREFESAKQTYRQLGADQRMAEIEEGLLIANLVKEKQGVYE